MRACLRAERPRMLDTAFLITAFVTMFVVIDPVGLAPLFVALTQGMTDRARRAIALRACGIAMGLLIVFALFGEAVLGFIGISMPAFRVAGGILLFLTALDMLFERRTKRREDQSDSADAADDPSVFPLAIPLIVMIRPRPGGFCYSPRDFAAMQRDVDLALEHDADGIAFGILTEDGRLDEPRCRQLAEQAQGRETVFHRAFDVVPDPAETLEQLIDMGITRVLTSGQEASAYNGAEAIARYVEQAAGRIEILPGGGINRFTLADVLARTGCTQVHASLTTTRTDASTQVRPHVTFGGSFRAPEDRFSTTDTAAVADLRRRLDELDAGG